jgi:hypothetical protein
MRPTETDVDWTSVRFLMDEFILFLIMSGLNLVPLCTIHYVSNSTTKEDSFRHEGESKIFRTDASTTALPCAPKNKH